MRNRVINILTDSDGKTIGAKINMNGRICQISTENLKLNKELLKIDNAIIDKN